MKKRPKTEVSKTSEEGFNAESGEVREEKEGQERKTVESRREPVKPRKACRIELGEGEPPSTATGEESRGARRKRRTITPRTSAVTSPGGCRRLGGGGGGLTHHRVDGRIRIIGKE